MRADFALLVLDAMPAGTRRSFLEDTVGFERARKDSSEYAILKANALLDDDAMRAAFAALKPGVTELQIAGVVRDYYDAHGAKTAFARVGFGENGAFPHRHTGGRVLKSGDAVLIDIGGRMNGYRSDMTRVAYCGEPGTEFCKIHAVLDRAVDAAVAKVKPGVSAKTIDKAARDVIADGGYGKFFSHRTGHGLGIDVHEQPYITASSETVLDEGHVFFDRTRGLYRGKIRPEAGGHHRDTRWAPRSALRTAAKHIRSKAVNVPRAHRSRCDRCVRPHFLFPLTA